ncbi:hypothetical protein N474_15120 [Pseudoalteromonas luteoviolacea CPMOR-2]|uniref:alpha/beta fold hydrolase n=1 Tax=Pseudoalteromonas luteoviolacea TaxID=43657 RepID=UPI0007B0AAFF|nr:alpha/beta hydrolase [Pseudoalteromonas luteoviolacea]KZN55315.1 hypothetical protein N474_15120 [Pseudoalteromonas luteoviolacea CPMOR-2]
MERKRIYVIAGTMCNHKLWGAAKSTLSVKVELIHLKIPNNCSFDEICRLLNESITEERVNLLGFSLGGYIAAYFSTLYPNKVSRLFIISNSPTKLSENELKQRNQTLAFIKNFGYGGLSASRARLLLDANNVNQKNIDLLQEMDRDLGGEEFISLYTHTSERHCLKARLLSMKIPLFFWYSESDVLVNTDWFDDVFESLPNCEICITPGSGHMLPIEQEAEFVRLLLNWVSRPVNNI